MNGTVQPLQLLVNLTHHFYVLTNGYTVYPTAPLRQTFRDAGAGFLQAGVHSRHVKASKRICEILTVSTK